MENFDRVVNWKLCLLAQLPLHHSRLPQHLHYLGSCTAPPVNLRLHSTLTNETGAALHLEQRLTPNPEGTNLNFTEENCRTACIFFSTDLFSLKSTQCSKLLTFWIKYPSQLSISLWGTLNFCICLLWLSFCHFKMILFLRYHLQWYIRP